MRINAASPSENLLAVITLFLCVCLVSPAIGGDTQNKLVAESTIEQVMKRGVLKVGMSTFVPWAMQSKTGDGSALKLMLRGVWQKTWALRLSLFRPNGMA